MDLQERGKRSFCPQRNTRHSETNSSALQLVGLLLIYIGAKQMNMKPFSWTSVYFISLFERTKPVYYSYIIISHNYSLEQQKEGWSYFLGRDIPSNSSQLLLWVIWNSFSAYIKTFRCRHPAAIQRWEKKLLASLKILQNSIFWTLKAFVTGPG